MSRAKADPALLADPGELEARRALLGAPHLAPLQPLLALLRAERGEVPDPDPLDGGAGARLLVLLETPGPHIRRTGIVSRDNPSGTARNLRRFLAEADLPRSETLIWNLVPFVIHEVGALNRAPRQAEIAAGLDDLARLLDDLPALRVVVAAGRVAGQAEPVLRGRDGLCVLLMPHPSPTFVCTSPAVPARIRAALGEARDRLAGEQRPGAGVVRATKASIEGG